MHPPLIPVQYYTKGAGFSIEKGRKGGGRGRWMYYLSNEYSDASYQRILKATSDIDRDPYGLKL